MRELFWKLVDLLDLEYFILRDKKIAQEGGVDLLKKRDRELYLQEIKPLLEASVPSNEKNLLLLWVRALRKQAIEKKEISAGQIWQQFDWFLGFLLVVFGGVTGCSTVLSILAYTGDNPVNIFEFFFFTVVAPWLFFLLAAFFRVFKITNNLGGLSSYILLKIFKKFQHHIQRKLDDFIDQRHALDIQVIVRQVLAKTQKYKDIFASYALYKLQFFAISFGLACLLTLLIKVCFFDLAFGWQTSLGIGPEFLERTVKLIAAPWSWFLPAGVGYPTLKEIEGSRIILKNGIWALNSNDLSSWWPFLAMSIATYNLALRVLLLFFVKLSLKRRLNSIKFSSPIYHQIISRMLTPVVEKAGEPEEKSSPWSQSEIFEEDLSKGIKDIIKEDIKCLVLIPDEISHHIDPNKIRNFLSNFGISNFTFHELVEPLITIDGSINEQLAGLLRKNNEISFIMLVQEAWQPPLQELLSFLKKVRKRFPDVAVVVALTGMPSQGGQMVPPRQEDIQIWKKKIMLLGDQELIVEEMSP